MQIICFEVSYLILYYCMAGSIASQFKFAAGGLESLPVCFVYITILQ